VAPHIVAGCLKLLATALPLPLCGLINSAHSTV